MGTNTVKKNTYKRKPSNKKEEKKWKAPSFKVPSISLAFMKEKRFKMSVGVLMIASSLIILLSMISFIFTGKADQSVIDQAGLGNMLSSGREVHNWIGLVGALVSHILIYNTFGIGTIALVPLLFVSGFWLLTDKELLPVDRVINTTLFTMIWSSILLGYVVVNNENPILLNFLCGYLGLLLADGFHNLTGWGTILILIAAAVVFVIYNFKVNDLDKKIELMIKNLFQKKEKGEEEDSFTEDDEEDSLETDNIEEAPYKETGLVPYGSNNTEEDEKVNTSEGKSIVIQHANVYVNQDDTHIVKQSTTSSEVTFDVNFQGKPEQAPASSVPAPNPTEHPASPTPTPSTEEASTGLQPLSVTDTSDVDQANIQSLHTNEQLIIEDMDTYDPKLELSRFENPDLNLLNETPQGKIKVTEEELTANQTKIVETLKHFRINIKSIFATIGPTVTLYEIVPDAGIKISKIRNLEDDIALSLAALGIRIIAPIPGKGTIGIEVPNENKELVSIRSVLGTEKFINTDKELPVALGRTISNEVFIADLAKMPHLLMAGATGQGKSVGINVILTSLLYKKHPSELKFVMIDPKKVELSLFNTIERHYLACLPDAEEAIITDTKKAIHVLNSLCIEMDSRYDLLKKAGARNIKEYNKKFKNRKLNPNNGHHFLPYIVLVIDELADLMMTAGKEIEAPIARLAQLARAIGIHLVVATQRPSVDVITGMIKANFPARLSFRVTSKIDSRTILDTGGAEQLIGQGDMLLSNGNDIIRLQCAFVDTDEVERLCDFISSQQSYDTAYMLPEFEDESSSGSGVPLDDRDELFEEAARLLVRHQQGSTSLVQRKLSLGYNRAGRIIDQLEAAGIVGPFEGSKARQVLVSDEVMLEQVLSTLNG
ncbi:DNA translocase FtsK [Algivirga pacifica]|uniref:DNA translocase FtsK n=1 Tax=Algivirga pacifica TaxID=1162670 RepID=A0ABP9D9V6_9BACT